MLKLDKIVIGIKFYHKLPGQHVWLIRPDLEFKPVRALWNHYVTVVILQYFRNNFQCWHDNFGAYPFKM